MKIVIVIPTYNEFENVSKLAPVLATEFSRLPQHQFVALIVDGNSPDGTGKLVSELSAKYPFLQLLTEQKKAGLGAAYMYGFSYALSNLSPDVLIEMDADFQHDPQDIRRFVAELEKGSDYVIGSRFISGGSIPKHWSLHRKLLSWGGSLFSKVVLGIYTINDFTSGYKASRVKGFLDKIDLTTVRSSGFAYKIDLLFKMYKIGAKITEIPITFGLRDRGDSKMERNNLQDSIKVVLMLRYNESKSFFKFCIVGFIGMFTDISLFNLLRYLIFASSMSSAVSGFLAMLTTYTLNNYWSFSDRKIQGNAQTFKKLLAYIVLSYVPIAFRSFLVNLATARFSDTILVANVAFMIGVVIGLIWNFTVYSKIIWKN